MARETTIISASIDKSLAARIRKLSMLTDRGNVSALIERALLRLEAAMEKKKGAQ